MIRELKRTLGYVAVFSSLIVSAPSFAQDSLPRDSSAGLYDEYHPSPAYRESESHPLRILAYIVHPIGWLAREVIFRPFSYFASSTPETRAIMGYREPHDFRRPSCFSKSDSIPDCRQVKPFDYDNEQGEDNLDEKIKEALEAK
jgi:hypothetical protein